ncbi:acyl-CoA dehydrogenase family protein [Actinoallomurus bryophytorum]|uniref:Acyl-CoA dehydrogenase n=1 Tax=Actinoallomurus bryophytorum TaxID=1490222 RepID=A0A543CUX8_9ACTN|nr:acyl-CoA dehydrogenase family protein [Actinoallomurus bryophytorum]TQM00903.1 acyl-CoA dehydrogenase [Actinoallomurus bryophytorum]
MDFDLPETATDVRDGILKIGMRYGPQYWDRCDADECWPQEIWQELIDGGWATPERYSGAGQGLLELAVAAEALAASGAGSAGALLYLLTPAFGALTIARHGTPEQKDALLSGPAAGELETCLALNGEESGSDVFDGHTLARRSGGDFIVTGGKTWITGVERTRYMILATRTAPVTKVIPRGSDLTVLLIDVEEAVAAGTLSYEPIAKLGNNTAASSTVFFEELRVPATNVIGAVGNGSAVLSDILNSQRIISAAGAAGSADLALETACDHSLQRAPLGHVIGARQGIARPLARIKAQTELVRLMTYKAAWMWDHHRPCGSEAGIANLSAADTAWQATDLMFQLHGANAYARRTTAARLHRDAQAGRTIPGTEELSLPHIGQHRLGLSDPHSPSLAPAVAF